MHGGRRLCKRVTGSTTKLLRWCLPLLDTPAVQAPSIGSAGPLISLPCGPQRKAINPATFSSLRNLRDGWRNARNASSPSSKPVLSRCISCRRRQSITGVGTVPEQMALEAMPVRTTSSATARVNPTGAVLVVM